ncbi:hypothetical protein [Priestia endophytica]|uniref:hypothetical protein n=1 Tax=Priestia endophytica TaxID=135735 RepID=UPI000F53301D|nr:hypothetical protein [Priestia endophytica]RPK01533.1 hypothetical protein FH5_02374 [Priestia endophytica]
MDQQSERCTEERCGVGHVVEEAIELLKEKRKENGELEGHMEYHNDSENPETETQNSLEKNEIQIKEESI